MAPSAAAKLAHLVGHLCDLDGAFGSGEALVASQESEALGLLAEQTSGEVAVAYADLTVVGDGTVDAE